MKKFLIAIFFASSTCLAQTPGQPFGPPPFSNIYQKPVLSPYVFLDQNFSFPYYRSVKPLIEQEDQQREIQRQNKKIYKLQNESKIIYQNQMRSTGHNSENYQSNQNGIRPTGHPSYFMNKFHYH